MNSGYSSVLIASSVLILYSVLIVQLRFGRSYHAAVVHGDCMFAIGGNTGAGHRRFASKDHAEREAP